MKPPGCVVKHLRDYPKPACSRRNMLTLIKVPDTKVRLWMLGFTVLGKSQSCEKLSVHTYYSYAATLVAAVYISSERKTADWVSGTSWGKSSWLRCLGSCAWPSSVIPSHRKLSAFLGMLIHLRSLKFRCSDVLTKGHVYQPGYAWIHCQVMSYRIVCTSGTNVLAITPTGAYAAVWKDEHWLALFFSGCCQWKVLCGCIEMHETSRVGAIIKKSKQCVLMC